MKLNSVFNALLCLSLGSSQADAQNPTKTEANECLLCGLAGAGKEKKDVEPIQDIAKKLECGSSEGDKKGAERMKEIIAEDEATPVLTISQPTSRTSSSVTYKIDPEKKLMPGESIYIAVPDEMASRPVRFFVLGHRQDPNEQTGTTPGEKWDNVPGLTSVQFYNDKYDKKDRWRYWGGPASGGKGAKFAEVRPAMEMENLYDWRKLGHVGLGTGQRTTEPLMAKVIRLESMGKDPVKIGEVTLKVDMGSADKYVESIFSKGTSFGDFEKGKEASLGGGQAHEGKFPNAIELRRGKTTAELPDGWKHEGTDLIIPLPPGKVLTGVEVAGGDTHPDGVRNSDGGFGTQGWARLSIGLDAGKKTDWMLQDENVPPEGVMMGSPATCGYVTKPGDKIRIRGTRDSLYVMGVRVGLKDAP